MQGRLTESSGSLNDVGMKRVPESAEYEEVESSIFWCRDMKSTRTEERLCCGTESK